MNAEYRSLPPKFDLFKLAGDSNPYRGYSELRAAGPLLRAGPGLWAVPRYSEVAALLRDPRLGPFRFHETLDPSRFMPDRAVKAESAANSFLDGLMVVADGPDHARLRKVVAPALLQRLTPQLKTHVALMTDGLLDGFADARMMEVVSELAYPVPLMVLSHLLGIPGNLQDTIGREVLKLSKLFSSIVSPADRAEADLAVMFLRDCLGPLFDRRFESPADDLISDLTLAMRSGLLSRSEAIDNAIFLTFAGLETSISLISTGCVALANHQEQMARLRINPACVPTAIDEFLRFDAPTQITARTVQTPFELAGRRLSKGRVLLLLLGSANHDERQFSSPEQLDVERHPNPHLSFGAGAHYCLGAALAKLESEVIFARLAQRFSAFELAGEVVREPCATPRIYSKIPIGVRAA